MLCARCLPAVASRDAGRSGPCLFLVKVRLGMQEYGDQHQPEPSLPSAEELRERVALGQMAAAGVAAAPAGSLGHLMLVSARLLPCLAPREGVGRSVQ